MLINKPQNCSDVRWMDPVRIRLGYGLPESIGGPLQALNCLVQRWPKNRGQEYARAKQLCMAALGDRIPCDGVRAAFVAAAEESDILVGERVDISSSSKAAAG